MLKIDARVDFGSTCPLPVLLFGRPLYESCNNHTSERRKALKSRQRPHLIGSEHQTVEEPQCVLKISNFNIFGSRDTPLVQSQRLRFKFVSRFGTTDRKQKARKIVEKYGWTKRIHRFQKFGLEHPPSCKSMLMSISAQHAHYRYYSSAEPLYESYSNNTRGAAKH